MRFGIYAHVFNSSNLDWDSFQQLDGLNHNSSETTENGQVISLLTNVEEYEGGRKVISFYLHADYVDYAIARNEKQFFKRTAFVPIRIERSEVGADIYCYTNLNDSIQGVRKLKNAMRLSQSAITHLTYPPGLIKAIVEKDAIRLIRGNWKHLDANTTSGSLGGDLDNSAFREQFDHTPAIFSGARFESNQMQRRVVSVSNNGAIGIEGRDADRGMIVEYADHVIKPVLKGLLSPP